MSKTIKICPETEESRSAVRGRKTRGVPQSTSFDAPADARMIVDRLSEIANVNRGAAPMSRGNTKGTPPIEPVVQQHASADEKLCGPQIGSFSRLPPEIFLGGLEKPAVDPDQPPLVSPSDRRTAIDDVIDSIALAAVDEILLAIQGKGDPDVMAALASYRDLGEAAFALNPFVKDPRGRMDEVMHELGEFIFRNFRGRNTRCELGDDGYLQYASWAAIGELGLASTDHVLNEPELWRERLVFDTLSLVPCLDEGFTLFPCAEEIGTISDVSNYSCRFFAVDITCVQETPDDILGTFLGTDDFELRGRATVKLFDRFGRLASTTQVEAETYMGQFDTGTSRNANKKLFDFPINATKGARTEFEGTITPTEADLTSAELANAIAQVVDLLVWLGLSVAVTRFRALVASANTPEAFRSAIQMLIDSGLVPDNAVRSLEGLAGLLARALAPETLLGYKVKGVFVNPSNGGDTAPPSWNMNLEFRIFDPQSTNTLGVRQTLESGTAIQSLLPPDSIYRNRPVVLQQFDAARTSSGETLTQLPGQYQVRHRVLLVANPQEV